LGSGWLLAPFPVAIPRLVKNATRLLSRETLMHELAITENLLNLALRYAAEHRASRVTELNLMIGDFSGFVDDSIQFYWGHVSQDTLCEGARLNVQRVPARFACLDCRTEYVMEGEMTPCPGCSGIRIRLVSGDELRLESISIEGEAEASTANG
jgi:hydrogenase nickel incorporation protein HypA/HybF